MNKFREAKHLVEDVLKTSFISRNDDKELLINALALAGFKWDEDNLAIFRGFYSMETLRRVRQKLQEDGMYTASVEKKKSRKQAAKETAHFMTQEWLKTITIKDQQGNVLHINN